MSEFEILLQLISDVKEDLIFDKLWLEKSIIEKVEHSLNMRTFGDEGYGLLQQIDNKIDQLFHHTQKANNIEALDVDDEEDVITTIQKKPAMH